MPSRKKAKGKLRKAKAAAAVPKERDWEVFQTLQTIVTSVSFQTHFGLRFVVLPQLPYAVFLLASYETAFFLIPG